MKPYILEMIAIAIVVLGMIGGAIRGLLLTLYSLVKAVLVIGLAAVLYPAVEKLTPKDLDWRAGVAVLVALVIAIIVLGLVAKVIKLVDKIPVVGTLNHIGGAALGGVLGVLLVALFVIVITLSRDAEWCQAIYPAMIKSKMFVMLLDVLQQTGLTFFTSKAAKI